MINNRHGLIIFFLLWSLVSDRGFAETRIQVLGLFKNQAIILYQGERLRLIVNGPAKQGIKLVSADSDQAVLNIDGRSRAFKLGSASGFKLAKPVVATVKIAADSMGMYAIKGRINGHFIEFLTKRLVGADTAGDDQFLVIDLDRQDIDRGVGPIHR